MKVEKGSGICIGGGGTYTLVGLGASQPNLPPSCRLTGVNDDD
jgi:hypothetical protein